MFSLIAGVLSGACNAALLAVINLVVQKNHAATTLVWIFIGLCALLPLTRFTSEFFLTDLGQGATYNLRLQLCNQILAAPLRHLEQVGSARLLAALTNDIPAITAAILMIPLLCVNASLVIGCLVYMGFLSITLLLTVLGFMVFAVVTYQLPIVRAQKVFELGRKDATALHGHFRALTQGTKELKIHLRRRQAFINQELKATAASMRRHETSGENLYSAATSWGQTLVFSLIGVILFVFPLVRPVSGSMMISYALTLLYFMTPLQVVLNILPHLARANVSLKSTAELGLMLASQGTEKFEGTEPQPRTWRTLQLRSITHAYHREGESHDFILGPIDLNLKQGELVFITGGNGSGKTTFIKLLTGLYLPENGYIALDGEPIRDTDKEFYRQYFSAVFADFYLFEQILGLAAPELDDEANRYLSQLKLAHKVGVLKGKLSTIDLSQGQRKRLALLTAYLEDRPIYVFDEWAADQDPHFKAVFYLELLPKLKAKGKTVFVVSHDDRYYHVADRVIKLEDGQVVSDVANEVTPAALEAVG
jgi:putative ATP-binding cassette transporter